MRLCRLIKKTFYAVFLLFFNALVFYPKGFSQELKCLNRIHKKGVKISVFVERINDGKVLIDLNAEKRLSPASVSKLVVASKALDTWGSQKKFNSTLQMRGSLKDGILKGDLVFFGAGDPYLTNEKLWFLTTDVYRAGVRKITGRLVVNNSLFGDIESDANRRRGERASAHAYDSLLSSAAVNFSVAGIIVIPGQKIGEQANVALEPYSVPSVKLINRVRTGTGRGRNLQVTRRTVRGQDEFYVSGYIGVTAPAERIYRSVSDPERFAGEVLMTFLEHTGVTFENRVPVIEDESPTANDKIIASVQGLPLIDQVQGLLQESNNYIADMLLLNLAGGTSFDTSRNLGTKAQILEDYMKTILSSRGVNSQGLVLKSGSGLTPENRLSAKDVVYLLDKIYFDGNQFPEFLSSLAAPGETGTLKDRFKSILPVSNKLFIRAKTGTLSEPSNVVSLAGYMRVEGSDWFSFAFLINSENSDSSLGILNLRECIDSDLVDVLQSELAFHENQRNLHSASYLSGPRQR